MLLAEDNQSAADLRRFGLKTLDKIIKLWKTPVCLREEFVGKGINRGNDVHTKETDAKIVEPGAVI